MFIKNSHGLENFEQHCLISSKIPFSNIITKTELTSLMSGNRNDSISSPNILHPKIPSLVFGCLEFSAFGKKITDKKK